MNKHLKFVSIAIATIILTTSLAGCGRGTSIQVPDQSIPFLTLVPDNTNNESVKKALLNFWDLKNGKIISTDKIVYSIAKKENADLLSSSDLVSGYAPLYWDGENHIILSDAAEIQANVYKHTEVFGLPKELSNFQYGRGRNVIFGKDVEMVRIATANKNEYKYRIRIWNGNKYIDTKREINFSAHQLADKNGKEFHCEFPVAISKDGDKLYILVSGPYSLETGIRLCLCTMNLKNGLNKWVNLYFGSSPSSPALPTNVISVKDKFYLLGNIAISAKNDENDDRAARTFEKRIEEIEKSLLPAESETEIARGEFVIGSYKSIVIVVFIIHDTSGSQSYTCALKDNKLLGVLHRVNGQHVVNSHIVNDGGIIEVMDKNGKILSKYSTKTGTQCIFPRTNGGI